MGDFFFVSGPEYFWSGEYISCRLSLFLKQLIHAYHRCHGEKIYLSAEYLCDNIVHCLYSHDDESICDEVSNFGQSDM